MKLVLEFLAVSAVCGLIVLVFTALRAVLPVP